MLKLENIIIGLGGIENIELIDNCMTKLRIVLKDNEKVKRDIILSSGVKDALVFENNIHIPVGINAKQIADSLKKLTKRKDSDLILQGLGGKENIKEISTCMTKLKARLHDKYKINKEILLQVAKDVLVLGEDIHILIGIDSKNIFDEIK